MATDWPPFNYMSKGKASGYINDYMRLLAHKAGLTLEFVPGKSWPEYMEMVADNELDCISNMTITEKRKGKFLFSRDAVVDVVNGLLVRSDERQPANIEAFRNRVIAVARGYSQQELLTTYYPDIELLLTDNLQAAMWEVIAGRADAAVGAHAVFKYYINKYLLTEVRSTPIATNDLFPSAPHYIAVNPQKTTLLSILDKAAATITPQEINKLQDYGYITFSQEEKIHFTEIERLYLEKKKVLSVCVDPNWMPIEKIEKGEHVGISAEYMKLFSEKIGIPITLHQTASWEETVEAATTRKCDFISMAISTPERRKHFLFSHPYLTSPLVMATKSNSGFLPGLTAANYKKVGITGGYAFAGELAGKYPDIQFVPVTSIDKGLSMVRDGELFGYVDSLLSLAYTIQKKYTGELKIATEANLRLELNMAIRNDQPELLAIFNKAILSLDNSDHQQILNKWISVKYEEVTHYRLLLQIFAGAVFLFGILLYRHYTLRKLNRKLQLQNLEIRKNSEALKSTQQQLLMTQHAIDSCAFPIFWICMNKEMQGGRVVHANIQAATTLGYSLDEFLALSMNEITQGESADSLLHFNDAHNGGSAHSSISSYKRKDGTSLPVEQYISSFKYADIYCNFVFFQDISKRLEMEARLHRSMKMETIGMMAGGVAHDLNNILSGIVSYPELVLMKLPKESKIYGHVETIRQSGIKAANIVADLLTVARGAAATIKNINLNALIQEYVSSPECKQLKASHQGVTLELHLAPDLDNVSCSPIHISKSVMNLVTNAFEVTKAGQSIVLSTFISEHPPKTLKSGRYVVISVEDTGGGIPEDFLPHIFEPFYTKKTMGKSGTGLGLTIVWNSAQDHGGGVFAENVGGGSRFRFYLPATTQTAPQSEGEIQVSALHGSGEKILVIDDELQQRNVARHMLEILGYQGTFVSSGESGIERALTEKFDLILIDMIMAPGIGGRETYEKIIAKRKNQRAIIVSGFADDIEVKTMMALGVSQFVKKPYSLKDLAVAINKGLTS
ncbi:transporter substrate-binding domain-containing protein [Desulfogranum marinum]|uniref:transporter substrate-binding domain-containing protein n=1 Tax=Desulfogranum marinum TaxID=453220 RepID=UPI001962D874|nr:transporter substrate-binding domain-containing protein [Desulfogranum marinum]